MSVEVEVATIQVLQLASDRLRNIQLDDVIRIWHHVGQTIEHQLDHKKGTRIERVGTFTLDIKGRPIFAFQDEFLSTNRVRAPQQPTSDQLSTSTSNRLLNHSQVALSSGDDRNLVEKVIKLVVETLYQVAGQGQSVALAFLPVGEMFCAGKTSSMRFTDEFLASWDRRLSKETQVAVRAQAGQRGNQPTERMKGLTRALEALNTQNGRRPSSRGYAAGSTPRSSVADFGSSSSYAGTPRSSVLSSTSSLRHTPAASSSRRRSAGHDGSPMSAASRSHGSRPSAARPSAGPTAPKDNVVERVRRKIMERAGGSSAGIKGLGSVLKLMDDNGDKKISKVELKYGLRNYGTDLSDSELEEVMAFFDRDRNGTIDFDEFLRGMRGQMNERRRAMVDLAFDVLDATGDGRITVDDLQDAYDLSWHPGVKNGTLSREQALRDFLSQWDRREKDGIVTRDEFHDYYEDVSASVDSDTYFELMIRNAWHISGGEGQAANSANLRVLVTHADGRQSIEEVKNDLGLKAGDRSAVLERLRRQGIAAQGVDVLGGVDDGSKQQRGAGPSTGLLNDTSPAPAAVWAARLKEQKAVEQAQKAKQQQQAEAEAPGETAFDVLARLFYSPPKTLEELIKALGCSLIDEDPQIALAALGSRIQHLDPKLPRLALPAIFNELDVRRTKYVNVWWLHKELADRYGKDRKSAKPCGVIERVQAKIRQRSGEASLKGLARTLALFDDNGDKKISKMELKYGLEDYGVPLNQRELDDVMNFYDRDKDGTINFDEFLRGMRGQMNERRRAMVDLAFDVLDATGDGRITVDDLQDAYDLSWHPGVKNGTLSREQALRDFLSQWDRREKDGIVTRDEFHDYYEDVSASVDSDTYFELMIRNAWHISGGEGQAANSANLRVLVTHADGRQSVQEVKKSLGVRRGDVATIKSRLKEQGTDVANVDLKGEAGDKASKGQSSRRPPPRQQQSQRSSSQPPRQQQQQQQQRPSSRQSQKDLLAQDAHSRHAAKQRDAAREAIIRLRAAVKLQALFRAHKARAALEAEKRKVAKHLAMQQQMAEEEAKARAATQRYQRPKLKGYYGF